MLFDLHMHSHHSYDSLSRVEDILRTAKRRRLSGIAITDHDTFGGAQEAMPLAARYDLLLVPAMEVTTEEGDVLALFLKEEIHARAFDDVVAEVEAQDGIAVLAHPFKRRRELPDRVIRRVHAIETFNARGQAPTNYDCNARARRLAASLGKPGLAGSDAHFLWEIGRAGIESPAVRDLEGLKHWIRRGATTVFTRKQTTVYADVLSQCIKAYKLKNGRTLRRNLTRFGRVSKWYVRQIVIENVYENIEPVASR